MKIVERCNIKFGFFITFEGNVIHEEYTPFNDVVVFDNNHFGRVMMINDSVQFTTMDESIYHKAMVAKVPSYAKSVLVIGGGDGGIARELRNLNVDKITIVDLDKRISEISKMFFPSVWNNLDKDTRCELVFQDAMSFVDKMQEYDYCVVDLTDPDVNSKDLYTKEFFEKIKCKGLSIQLGTPNMQRGQELVDMLREQWNYLEEDFVNIPCFIGGPLLIAYCNAE